MAKRKEQEMSEKSAEIVAEEEQLNRRLRELWSRAHIKEQPFASDKPIIGRLIVFIREKWNSVAARWYVRPMLHQQNLFNQAATRMIQELLERSDELDRRVIGSDQDLTLLARKVAEGEYEMRQWDRRVMKERDDLARRLSRLETMLARSPGTEESGEKDDQL
jgi:hypothetical protein